MALFPIPISDSLHLEVYIHILRQIPCTWVYFITSANGDVGMESNAYVDVCVKFVSKIILSRFISTMKKLKLTTRWSHTQTLVKGGDVLDGETAASSKEAALRKISTPI